MGVKGKAEEKRDMSGGREGDFELEIEIESPVVLLRMLGELYCDDEFVVVNWSSLSWSRLWFDLKFEELMVKRIKVREF